MTTQDLRIVFLGTPLFSVPTLERLIERDYQIVAVYTQPDRPAGRSGQPAPTPVKRVALEHGLPVYQPRSLRRPEAQEELRAHAPDMLVLAAYGLILPQPVLDIPRYGGLNVHPSLLPRHRGPAPIVGALLAGDTETGVTIMLMDAGMDTGPLLTQRRFPINEHDTTASLTGKLAEFGADLLVDTIEPWTQGSLTPQLQDETLASTTRLLSKEDGRINWQEPAEIVARKVRAYQPWPGTSTTWKGQQLTILSASHAPGPSGTPGLVVQRAGAIVVETGQGLLELRTVQLQGKRALPIEEFARGAQGFIGSRLGNSEAG